VRVVCILFAVFGPPVGWIASETQSLRVNFETAVGRLIKQTIGRNGIRVMMCLCMLRKQRDTRVESTLWNGNILTDCAR
jgi:hypothetical protein